MDREHVKGAADKVKGAIKDTAGKLTGDKKLQSEGKFDKAKGSAHNLVGDVKDTARNLADDWPVQLHATWDWPPGNGRLSFLWHSPCERCVAGTMMRLARADQRLRSDRLYQAVTTQAQGSRALHRRQSTPPRPALSRSLAPQQAPEGALCRRRRPL